jgi:hypothetical protein
MVCFSTLFCCSSRSILFFIGVKKCAKAYHTLCSPCRSTHLESNTIGFSILAMQFFNVGVSASVSLLHP